MAEMYEVVAKVVSQKGTCPVGHKVGDEWIIEMPNPMGPVTPGGMCIDAYNALAASVKTLTWGGVNPWEDDPERTMVACPDADNPIVFELRRLRD